jgi:hypothetical protein
MSQTPAERRQWPRIPAAALGNISAAVVAGPDVKLVDLSRGGAMMEVAARFPMRSSIRLKLTQSTGEVTVAAGRVAWAKVSSIIEGRINYRVAVVFEQPIPDLVAGMSGAGMHDQQTAASAGSDVAPVAAGDAAVNHPEGSRLASIDQAALETDAASEVTVAIEPVVGVEEDRAPAIFPPRGNLTRFPTGAAVSHAAHAAQSDEHRTDLPGELETERRRWEEERSKLLREAADAFARADELQTERTAQEQKHEEAMGEQQGRYEALIAELIETNNEQHTEYQHLLDSRTAALDEQRSRAEQYEADLARHRAAADQQFAELQDEQRSRAEHYEAEFERHRAAAEQQSAELQARQLELEARLEAAESLCAAHDARARGLRREAERLMSMITSPVRPGSSQQDEAAAACETGADDAQAVA